MTDYQTELDRLSGFVTSQVEFEQASHENRAKNAQHAAPSKEPRCDTDLIFYLLVLSVAKDVYLHSMQHLSNCVLLID